VIEQRVRDLVIHHGIGPEDDAEGLVRGILALVAETDLDDRRLARAIHHAMCLTSHHDRDVENARCFPMYRNIALSTVPAYRQDKA
jgi:hypothetical protein